MRQEGAVEGALTAKHQDDERYKKKNKKYQPIDKRRCSTQQQNKTVSFKGNYPPSKHFAKLEHAPFKCWRRPDAKCSKCNQLGHEATICKNNTQQQDIDARVVNE